MTVEAIVGDIDLAADKPLGEGGFHSKTFFHGLNQESSFASPAQKASGFSRPSGRGACKPQARKMGRFAEFLLRLKRRRSFKTEVISFSRAIPSSPPKSLMGVRETKGVRCRIVMKNEENVNEQNAEKKDFSGDGDSR